MATTNDFLRLKQLIAKYLRLAVRDPRFGHSKLTAVADELGLTPDEFNNLLYTNRVDINESYVQSAVALLTGACPELAERMMQEWLMNLQIKFTPIMECPFTCDDVKTLFLKAIREVGDLGGQIAEHESDGRITREEAARDLQQIEVAISYLNALKSRRLRDQAAVLDAGNPRKSNARTVAAL